MLGFSSNYIFIMALKLGDNLLCDMGRSVYIFILFLSLFIYLIFIFILSYFYKFITKFIFYLL